MRPTHSAQEFTAQRQFTDRTPERAAFTTALRSPQSPDEYRVLNWFGVGGQGKSALSREFVRICEAESTNVAVARVDLHDIRFRSIEEFLLSVRLQLSRTFGHRFGAFDTAFARYFALTNPGTDIRAKHPELFRGENAVLDDLIELSEAGIDLAVTGASLVVPGLNILYKYGIRISARTREWIERRGKTVLEGLHKLDPDELLERLPTFLGSDICELKRRKPDIRTVVLVDTHEALWRDHNLNNSEEGGRVDAWLRLFVQDSAGTLFTIFGRDEIQWAKNDADWAEAIKSRRLDGLSDEDADAFLKAVPINLKQIRAAIIAGAQGLPFFLDLQVDLFERKFQEKSPAIPEDFGGSKPEILSRFLDHISGDEQKLLRLTSYPQVLSEELLNDLAETFLGGIGNLNWKQLRRFSFIEENGDGDLIMHALMRDELQMRERDERPDAFKRIHAKLFEKFDALALTALPSQIFKNHEVALADALRHAIAAQPEEWWNWFHQRIIPFQQASGPKFLEKIYRHVQSVVEIDGRETPEALLIRACVAQQLGKQGRFTEAEEEFKAIWRLRREREPLGESDPLTLTARHNMAQQIGNQGRHAEAEAIFRAIWEIDHRRDNPGKEHGETLMTRYNIAQQMAYQGKYAEAEQEFREVWKIWRRPDVYGEEHHLTLIARHEVAQQAGNQGQHIAAALEFKAIWEIERRADMLGEENSDTLITRHNMAQQIGYQGRHAEAEAEFRAIWEILSRDDKLGAEHPDTLTARASIAQQIGYQGRYAQAEAEFRAIWEILRRDDKLGEEHPTTLSTQANIARLVGKQERYAEAEVLLRAIWSIGCRPEVLGEEHPDNLRLMFYLAEVLDAQNKVAEADALLENLDVQLAKSVSEAHMWRNELKSYLTDRGR